MVFFLIVRAFSALKFDMWYFLLLYGISFWPKCCYYFLYSQVLNAEVTVVIPYWILVSTFRSVYRTLLGLNILSVFIKHLCTLKKCVFTPSVLFV